MSIDEICRQLHENGLEGIIVKNLTDNEVKKFISGETQCILPLEFNSFEMILRNKTNQDGTIRIRIGDNTIVGYGGIIQDCTIIERIESRGCKHNYGKHLTLSENTRGTVHVISKEHGISIFEGGINLEEKRNRSQSRELLNSFEEVNIENPSLIEELIHTKKLDDLEQEKIINIIIQSQQILSLIQSSKHFISKAKEKIGKESIEEMLDACRTSKNHLLTYTSNIYQGTQPVNEEAMKILTYLEQQIPFKSNRIPNIFEKFKKHVREMRVCIFRWNQNNFDKLHPDAQYYTLNPFFKDLIKYLEGKKS